MSEDAYLALGYALTWIALIVYFWRLESRARSAERTLADVTGEDADRATRRTGGESGGPHEA